MLTTFPLCKFSLEFPEILSKNPMRYHWLKVSGNSEIIHSGLPINYHALLWNNFQEKYLTLHRMGLICWLIEHFQKSPNITAYGWLYTCFIPITHQIHVHCIYAKEQNPVWTSNNTQDKAEGTTKIILLQKPINLLFFVCTYH